MKHLQLSHTVPLLWAAFLALSVGFAQSAVPSVITYQGQMLVAGEAFTGNGQFKFALVDAGTDDNTQAIAAATVTGGFITAISVGDSGSGYVDPPTVTITDGTGTGAVATATIAGGIVTGITVNNAGSGYSGSPVVTVDSPPSVLSYATFWSNDGTSVDGSEPTGAVNVVVNGGLFTVGLGDSTLANMTAILSSVFDNDGVHLRIWFNDGTSGFAQLDVDQPLTSAPYAVRSKNVEWSGISGTPPTFADGVDNVNDADSSTSNEIQNLTLSGTTLSLSLGGGSVSLSAFTSPWNNSGSNLYFNTGNVGIGDNSPVATLSIGNGDKLQIHGADGDIVFTDDEGSIRFSNTTGENAAMINMFASGTNNTNRMVLAHSPSFQTWGLRYDDVPDQFNFIGDNQPVMSIQVGGQQRVGIGTFTPEAKLHIVNNSATGFGQIKLTENQYDYSRITMNNNIHSNYWDIAARSDTNLANAQLNFYHSDGGDIFSVNARGRIGINDASPSYAVEINGNQSTRIINAYNNLATTTSTTYNYGVRVNLSQAANTGFPRLYNFYGISTDSDAYLTYGLYGYASGAQSNNYGVYAYAPTSSGYAGYFNGNTYATGSYQTSDRKFKINITSQTDGLGKVMALRPVTSNFDTEAFPEMNLPPGPQFGFLADEVATVMPELVKHSFQPYDEAKSDTAEGQGIEFDAVNYTGMIPVLVSAIQEQQALIDALRAEIDILKAKHFK